MAMFFNVQVHVLVLSYTALLVVYRCEKMRHRGPMTDSFVCTAACC